MKKLFLTFAIVGALAACAQAAEPFYAKTTPNPVVEPEPDQPPTYKKVCIDTKDKAGKDIKKCRTVKIHQKLDGTPVPNKTK